MKERNYLSRGWKEMRAQKGWARPVALIALMRFIPIFGTIAMDGFYYEWAREAAWKVDRPQATKYSKNFSATLKIGVLAWGVIIIWSAACGFVTSLFSTLPWVGTVLGILLSIATIVVSVVAMVAAMRAVIYDSFEPVLQIGQAFKMAKHDVGGLVHVFLIGLLNIVLALVLAAVISLFALLLLPSFGFLVYGAGWNGATILGALAAVPLAIIVTLALSYLFFFASSIIAGLEIRALGYWMADFEVAQWKGQKDQLPFERNQNATSDAAPVEPESEAPAEPEPAPEPEPESVPAEPAPAEPEPALESEPAEPEPEPAPAPEPEPAEPEPEPAPAPESEPATPEERDESE